MITSRSPHLFQGDLSRHFPFRPTVCAVLYVQKQPALICRTHTTASFKLNSSAKRPAQLQARMAVASTVGEAAVAPDMVELAHKLADAAALVTTKFFRTKLDVESKGDLSPVTIADQMAEAAMRELISSTFPDHGVFGEEAGLSTGSSDYLWVLDPIDGTRSFITGKPLWGTLIALLENGQPILGIIDQPYIKERWVGIKGSQTTLNGRPISTRSCPNLSTAYLYATSPHMFEGPTEVGFNRVRDAVKMPLYGCDCYAYGLVAGGYADLVVEANMKPYDYMALVPVVEGAGGAVSDWQGKAFCLSRTPSNMTELLSLPGEVLAVGDLRLQQPALDLLGLCNN